MIGIELISDLIIKEGLVDLFKALEGKRKKINLPELCNTKIIDLKAHSVIGRYICNYSDLAIELISVEKAINNYKNRKDIKRPLNVFISAPPGSGKSYLARQYYERFKTKWHDIDYTDYNLSSYEKIGALSKIMRYIKNKNTKHIIPIVFIDEIDTAIQGNYIFSHLLSLMADGKYDNGVNKYEHMKAILFFAGGSLFDSKSGRDGLYQNIKRIIPIINKSFQKKIEYSDWRDSQIDYLKDVLGSVPKFSDFLDRFDIFIVIPPLELNFDNYSLKDELRDLSAALILKHFKDIEHVEKAYLFVIMHLLYYFKSKRKAESAVFLTNNPKKKIIKFSDFPETIIRKYNKYSKPFGNETIKIIKN